MRPLGHTDVDAVADDLAPQKSGRRWPPFTRPYAALVATMVLARVALSLAGAGPVIPSQASALSWWTLAVLASLGWGALFLAQRVGFSAEWSRGDVARRWRLWAVPLGILYGVLTVSGDVALWVKSGGDLAHLKVFGTLDVHQRFPASLPFYWYGGVFLEIMLRLLALTALAWALRPVLGRGRPKLAFWAANALTALYEPTAFLFGDLRGAPAAAWPAVICDHLLTRLFLANLLTGYLYRESGLWAAVIFRNSFYLVWHVAYGGFRAYWLGLLL